MGGNAQSRNGSIAKIGLDFRRGELGAIRCKAANGRRQARVSATLGLAGSGPDISDWRGQDTKNNFEAAFAHIRSRSVPSAKRLMFVDP